MPVILATQKARDEEYHGSKPAESNLKKTHYKKGLVEWLKG
jgi:hypothetical protein